jgi:hypothetical protein
MGTHAPLAYGRHPVTGEVIAVRSGERGYWQVKSGVVPEERNRELGVSEEEAAKLIVQQTSL